MASTTSPSSVSASFSLNDNKKSPSMIGYPLGSVAVSIVLCKRLSADGCYPATLVAPGRRVGLRGDATRAPTQGPGFGAGGRSSFRAGPTILAIMR